MPLFQSKILQPSLILGDTILSLTPTILARYNIEGLILDVDETLVPLREKEVSVELRQWITEIEKVATIWLVSNNLSENRIGSIAQSLNLPYAVGAKKPSRKKLIQAATAMKLPIEKVAMVGDRLLTDVLAGNRLGMFTILVEPMVDPEVAARSYLFRNFEVWLSRLVGVSLAASQQKFTKPDKL
jgi:HAD superfamily phosphatase (TIGR01668 family)